MSERREVVGVVGAGTMGSGIAQIALEAGHAVALHDVDIASLELGRERIGEGLARRAAKLGLRADAMNAWVDGRLANLRQVRDLSALASESEVVIEAALEDLDLKRAIFGTLDRAASPDAILATNTSAISVAEIAIATNRPGRVLGLHFFNPAPVMTLVEVVVTLDTDAAVADRAQALMSAWGKTPVRCADTPGFIVNRVNRPFTIQALRLLEAGSATVSGIDGAMRAAGFPLGPFELMDLVGLDVNLAAARGIWDGLGRPDRLRPSPIQEGLVAEGRLGRKSGAGFYLYVDGWREGVAPMFAEGARRGEDGEGRGGPESRGDRRTAGDIQALILAAVDAEAREAVAEGVATARDIDLAMRAGAGHPTGPFERARESAKRADS